MKYAEFSSLSVKERINYLKAKEMSFCLFAQQYDREKLEMLFERADFAKGSGEYLTDYRHKTAMLYFTQPSTRTFLSFDNACHHLGIRTSEIRDTKTSSELKGETIEDSVITLSMYSDLIIMRSPEKELAQKIAWLFSIGTVGRKIPIINAGSGSDQHPTQALLDMYTLRQNLGNLDNKEITLMGDLKRSRTIHSLVYLLANYNVKLNLVSPLSLRIGDEMTTFLKEKSICFNETDRMLSRVKLDSDAFYVTRCQSEHGTNSRLDEDDVDYSEYSIGLQDVEVMKKSAIILHPLPRRGELSYRVDRDPRAKYWEQVRNGMFVRMALIDGLMSGEDWSF